MAEVPHDRSQILQVGAARARVVAAELDRLHVDLAKSGSDDLADAVREEGLNLLAAARGALNTLHDSLAAKGDPDPSEV